MTLPVLLSLLACNSCQQADDVLPDSDAEWEVLAEGSGPENVEPLWAIPQGQRMYGSGDWDSLVIDGVLRHGDDDLTRVVLGDYDVTYYRMTEDGLEYHGSQSGGIRDVPQMRLLNTVRVGMRWVGDTEFEVLDRREEATAWGDSVVWDIVEHGADYSVRRTFIEGVGPVIWLLTNRDGSAVFDGGANLGGQGVMPETPAAVVDIHEVGAEPFALRHASGDSALGNVVITDLVMVDASVIEASSGLPVVAVEGTGASGYDAGTCIQFLEQEQTGELQWFVQNTEHTTQQWSGGLYSAAQYSDCGMYSGTNGDGVSSWTQPFPGGAAGNSVIDGNTTHWLGGSNHFPPAQSPAWLEGPGQPRTLAYPAGLTRRTWDPVRLHHPDGTLLDDEREFSLPVAGMWTSQIDRFDGQSVLLGADIGRLVSEQSFDDGALSMIGIGLQGGMAWSTWAAGGEWGDFEMLDASPGRPVARKGPEGAEVLFVQPDGAIDMVRIGDERPVRMRLADVDVPEGHVLTAAWRLDGWGAPTVGERLLLTTWGPDDEIAVWQGAVEQAAAAVPDPSQQVWAGAHGTDAWVCWPASLGAPSLDGWELGGQSVSAVPFEHSGQCVLLVRDATEAPEGGYGNWAIRGDVPGVGPVRIALGYYDVIAGSSTFGNTRAAVVDGGQVLGAGTRFSAAGTPLRWGELGRFPVTGNPVVWPDASGEGVWVGSDEPTSRPSLLWYGADGTVAEPDVTAATVVGPSEGGGLVARITTDTEADVVALLEPGGDWQELDFDGDPSELRYSTGRLADGTLCWADQVNLSCRDPDGTMRTGTTDESVQAGFAPWVGSATSDGLLLLDSWEGGLLLLDPEGPSVSAVADIQIIAAEHDASGELWGLGTDASNQAVIGRIDGDGWHALAVERPERIQAMDRLLVQDEVVTVWGTGGMVRIPR